MKDHKLVLVIGAPRSGTTLLAGLLSAGKDVSPMLPECTYITQLIEHFYKVLHYSDSQRFAAYAIDEEKLTVIYRSMIDLMIANVKLHFKDTDYRFLVLKDPELTNYVDLIPCFFGKDSKTVCVVRDPRAVIASMAEVERKKRKILFSEWIKNPNYLNMYSIVNQLFSESRLISNFFIYYYRIQVSELYKNGLVHIVQYEKIVAREEDEFSKLEKYLGFDVGREGFGKAYFDFDRDSPTYSSGYGQTISTRTSNFEKKLSARKINKIKSIYSGMNEIYRWWK